MRVLRGGLVPWRREIGPGGRNEGAAAVRQHEHEMQLTAAMGPAQDGQRPPFKGMVRTSDRDAGRKILEVVVGSV